MADGLVAPDVGFRKIIGFPNPVNEKAARTVAGGVLLLSSVTLVLSLTASPTWLWLTAPISLGFLARVLTGPRLRDRNGCNGDCCRLTWRGASGRDASSARSDDHRRRARVDLRVLCRLQDLRRADAARSDS